MKRISVGVASLLASAETQAPLPSILFSRPTIENIPSTYLVHEGFQYYSSDCFEDTCVSDEYAVCCDYIFIDIHYPTINRYSLAWYPHVGDLILHRRYISEPILGWGEPYPFYWRFEFDTGEDAWSYKFGGWYYYRQTPRTAVETIRAIREEALSCLDGVPSDCPGRGSYAVLGFAVSHEQQRGAVAYYDPERGEWLYGSGQGKVLYYYMPEHAYKKYRERAPESDPEEDEDDWQYWVPYQGQQNLKPKMWRVILLLNPTLHVARGPREAWVEYNRLIAEIVPDAVTTMAMLETRPPRGVF